MLVSPDEALLVALASFALAVSTGDICAAVGAVTLATISLAAHQDLSLATCAQEESASLMVQDKGTAGHVHDINEGNALLHGQERMVFADAGYRGIEKRSDAMPQVCWHVAMRPGKRKALDKSNAADTLLDAAEKLKAGVRAKVEQPFRVIKRQFGYVKVRYRGLKKNTQQLITLFALSNLWMVRGQLMGAGA